MSSVWNCFYFDYVVDVVGCRFCRGDEMCPQGQICKHDVKCKDYKKMGGRPRNKISPKSGTCQDGTIDFLKL